MSTPVDSDIDIVNIALDLLNETTIVTFDDDTKAAKQSKRYFAQARRACIRSHPWNFAMKRAELAVSMTTPVFGFTYLYPLPSDCLRVYGTNIVDESMKFQIEGRNIVTDFESLKILYLFDQTDPTKFDTLFIDALSAKIAQKLAYPLTGDRGVVKDMNEMYLMYLREARGVDAMEGSPQRIEAEEWLLSRYAGPDADVPFRPIADS